MLNLIEAIGDLTGILLKGSVLLGVSAPVLAQLYTSNDLLQSVQAVAQIFGG